MQQSGVRQGGLGVETGLGSGPGSGVGTGEGGNVEAITPVRMINTAQSQGLGGMSPIPSQPTNNNNSAKNNINNNDKPRRQPPKMPHPYTNPNANPSQQPSSVTGASQDNNNQQTSLEVEDLDSLASGDTRTSHIDHPASSPSAFSPLVLPADRAGPSRFATSTSTAPPVVASESNNTAPPSANNHSNSKKDSAAWFNEEEL